MRRNLLLRIPKAIIRRFKEAFVLLIASRNTSRAFLNAYYSRLSASQRSRFHSRYARIFRNFRFPAQSGSWKIEFLGKELKLPLSAHRMWLDWDTAISIIGHDIEVKETYEEILRSPERPSLFFDVGANYGTHSLLMASQGVKVYAFEPNADCIIIGQELFRNNGLSADWCHIAVGCRKGEVCLTYPKRETWLGSISTTMGSEEEGNEKEIVGMQPLDDYMGNLGKDNLLIKMDVEGSELEVIKGSDRLLATAKPLVIFESNEKSERQPVYEAFRDRNYEIFELPWSPRLKKKCLTRSAFVTHPGTNFLAAPLDRFDSQRA